MRTIKIKELEVPKELILEVAGILAENKITNELCGADEDNETVTVEVHLEKGNEEMREAVSQIEEMIEDFQDESEEEEDEN
jgi:DNA-binding response OmpR family regulator